MLLFLVGNEIKGVDVRVSYGEGTETEWFDLNNMLNHPLIWDDVRAVEAAQVTFRVNGQFLNEVTVLAYEGEDMIANWRVNAEVKFNNIIERITN